MLGVTSREVRRKASEGSLPARRVDGPAGAEWRFYRTDVEAYRQRREGGAEDGRSDLPAVRHLERVALLQQEAVETYREGIEATRALTDRLGDLGDLRDTLAASAAVQTDASAAVRELTETIRDQAGEIAQLRAELEAERAQKTDERQRPWWRRIFGG
jgi:hypothetical protein